MSEESVSPQGVIEDLAEQIKRLSVDNAVLRTAIKQLQEPKKATVPDGPPAELEQEAAEISDMTVFDGGDPTTEPMLEE
jgi:hypothetical protein